MRLTTGRATVKCVTKPRVHREIERKLEVPPGFRLPSLERAGAGIGATSRASTCRLVAVYFDTADLRLARHRITLRRRTGGPDAGWHLKLPHADADAGAAAVGDDTTRDEVQLPLSAGDSPPARLTSLVLGVTRGAPMAPVVTLRTERRRVLVADTSGQPLAEVTDDRVAVVAGRRTAGRFRELEVEAAPGRTATDLDSIVAALVAAGAAESDFASKALRALGPSAAAPPDIPSPPPVGPGDRAGDAVQAFLAVHVTAFLREDLRVRRGLPDGVHRQRVAARRLRSGLRAFSPLLEGSWARQLSAELKWIGQELAASREIEVLEDRMLAGLAGLAGTDIAGAAHTVRSTLTSDDRAALRRVKAAMESRRYLHLLDALVDAARSPQLTDAAEAPAGTALPPLMRATWKRLAAAVRPLTLDGPDTAWHKARIRAKHARYAADALVPVFGKPALRLAAGLNEVTELLGRHQDASVAAETARSLAERDGVDGRAGYALGLLHEAQRAEILDIRRTFSTVWPAVAAKKRRRWLRTSTTGARR